VSLRQASLHKQRKVARAVTARKLLILMSGEPEQQAGQDPPYNPSQRPTTSRASSTPCLDSPENVCTLTVSPNAPASSRRTACSVLPAAPRPSLSALVSSACAGRPRCTA